MRNTIFILLSFFLLPNIYGQYKISGNVEDRRGNTLEFASVYLNGTKSAAATNETGLYELADLEEDEYELVASYLGYKDFSTIIYLDKDMIIDIVLEGSAFDLEEIEIKGTWAKENYPFASTNISEEVIEEKNTFVDVPFLLQYTPSVVVSSDAGGGVGYTGIRIRGVDPTRVNVNVNGIPLNDAESHAVYWVNMPDVMNSVNDVQIQRGVGTSTNGAGAFGATINMNTNRLKSENYIHAEAGLGSFNTKKLGFELGTGLLNDRFTLDGRYSLITSDGYVDRAKSALTSVYLSGARITKNQSMRLNIFTGHEITYQSWYGLPVQYLNDEQRRYNAGGIDDDFYNLYPYADSTDFAYENEVDNYRQNHYQFFYKRNLAPGLKMDAALHYTRGVGFYEQYKAGEDLVDYSLAEDEQEVDLIRRKWLDNHFFGMVYNINKSFEDSELIFGGGINQYTGRHFGEVDTVYVEGFEIPDNHTYYDNDAEKLDWNTYAKYQHNFGDLSVLGDLQYRYIFYDFLGKNDDGEDLDQQINHHFINPKVGVNYTINEYSSAYASFAVANREPNRDDYTESALSSQPKAERLLDYELGARLGQKSWSIGANLYYMKYKDHLVLTGKINDVGDYSKINIPDSYRAGIELDAGVKLFSSLDLMGSLTLSENKIKTYTQYVDDWDTWGQIAIEHEDTDISFSPSVIAGAEIKWDAIKSFHENSPHKLNLGLSTKYVGKQYMDNSMDDSASLDPFTYTDLRLSYGFNKGWLKNARLDLHVLNLFDAKYVSNGWIYRFKSSGYDPTGDNPYSMSDQGGEGRYNLIGLFPQATRHFMLKLSIDL